MNHVTDPLRGLGEFQYVLLEIKSGPSFAAKSVARVKKKGIRAKKKEMLARWRELSEWGTNIYFFFTDFFDLRHRLRRKGGTARSGNAVIASYVE